MTRRSVVLGLLGAALVAGLCFFNDRVLQQTYLVGNNMPASIYGVLIVFVVLINPLLRKVALTGRELSVILALTLAACCIPGGGLLRQMIPTMVMPHHFNKIEPGWKAREVVEKVPKQMLVDVSEDEDRVVTGFVQGMAHGGEHISMGQIPWSAWVRALLFWLPLVLALCIALIGLMVALHPQWSRNEHLPYPIAQFTHALLPDGGDRGTALFRQRAFWWTACTVLVVHMNNLCFTWFPDLFIRIPTRLDFSALGHLSETFIRGHGSMLLRPHIYLIIIGISYFIPSDVALSFGIGPILFAVLVGILSKYGINLMAPLDGYSYFSLKPQSFALFGANVGVIVAMLFTGRHYYTNVLRASLGMDTKEELDLSSIWGCRVFLIMTTLFMFQLWWVGVDLSLTIMYTVFMIIGFVVLSRVIAETGLIYLKCYYWPCATLWGIFGAQTTGPQALLLMMLTTTVLFIDPREALTPFMSNSLKVLEMQEVKIGRPAKWCVAAIVLALVVAIPVNLYLKYDMGSATGDHWANDHVPKNPFTNVVMIESKLEAQGGLETAHAGSFITRLGAISPNAVCMWAMFAGLTLVLLFTAARLRWTWWPLHPLMFVTWAATPLRFMGFSYLLGWLIKSLVSKYGGSQVYNRLKPVAMGLIAGEVLGALIPSIIGAVYFFATKRQPMQFNVIPG